MKNIIALFFIVVSFGLILTGCTSSAYKSLIKAGNDAIHEGDYSTALTNYSKAISEKETDEAKDIYTIVEHVTTGQEAFAKGNFEKSIESYNSIDKLDVEAFPVLKKVKRDLDKFLKQAQQALDTYTTIKKQIEKGKAKLDAEDFDAAIKSFAKVEGVEETYGSSKIEEIIKEAKKLRAKAEEKKQVFLAEQKEKAAEEKAAEERRIAEEERLAEEQRQKEVEEQQQTEQQANENAKLTPEEARELVYNYLKNTNGGDPLGNPNAHLDFEGERDDGDYVFRLYEVVIDDPETKEGHTATWGWYGIDPVNHYVYDAMNY